jgi:hypothetical protein
LAPLRAVAISPDLNWLAISERSRGGVWDLAKNERAFYVRGFVGASFGSDGALYADFPKFEQSDRAMGELKLDTRASSIAYKIEDKHVQQYGPILSVTKPNRKDGRMSEDIVMEVRDTATGKTLWSRPFPQEAPQVAVSSGGRIMSLVWRLSTSASKSEIAANPDLAKHTESVSRDPANFLVEVLDARTGKLLGGIGVDTNKGSFGIRGVVFAGPNVVVSDTLNRLLTYSLSSGEQVGKTFGQSVDVSTASGLIVAENELGQLLIYNLSNMEKRDELIFNSPIAVKRFSDDGKRLFVLTAAQTAYVLDVSGLTGSAAKSASN